MSSFSLIRRLIRLGLTLFERHQAKQVMSKAPEAISRTGDAMQTVVGNFKKGDYEAALAATEGLRENGKETGSYCFMRGGMLMELGQLDEAEQLLRKSITLDTDNRLLALRCSTLGQLLMKKERYEQAMNCFNTGLDYWPGKGGLYRDMAEVVLRRGGDPNEALKFAKKAVDGEAGPNSSVEGVKQVNMAENLATLAWAVANAGGARAEVSQLAERALPMAGTDVVSTVSQVNYHLGLAYVALEDYDETRMYMEKANHIDPKGRWGRDAKSMLDALCHR